MHENHRHSDGAEVEIHSVTALQRAILLSTEMRTEDSEEFLIQYAYRFEGCMNIERMQTAWQDVVAAHAALRSSFTWSATGEPLRRVAPEVKLDITVCNWGSLSERHRQELWDALRREHAQRSFTPSLAPLMRVAIVRNSMRDHRMLWTHHHLILDGWSAALVMNRLFHAYDARVVGEVPRFPADFPYARLAQRWCQHRATSDPYIRPTPYKPSARGAQVPGDQPKMAPSVGRYVEVCHAVDEALSQFVQQRSRALRISHYAFWQALWIVLQARLTASPTVQFGVALSGRQIDIAEIEDAVGMFLTVLPMRVDVPLSHSFQEVAHGMHELTPYLVDYPASVLASDPMPGARAARDRPFDVLFVFENYPGHGLTHQFRTDLRIVDFQSLERNDTPVTLIITPGTRTQIQLIGDDTLYSTTYLDFLLREYLRLAQCCSADTDARVWDIPVFLNTSHAVSPSPWHDKDGGHHTPDLVEEIEERVREAPLREAAVFADNYLSYGELNTRANRLAHWLRTQGAGAESVVAVFMPRSLEYVVVLLAVAKSGALYLPLDSSYPKTRLEFMIDDAQPDIIVAHSSCGHLLPETNARTLLWVDRGGPQLDTFPSHNLGITRHPASALYCIYTSGSTGSPKGVLGTTLATANRIDWMRRAHPSEDARRVAQRSPVGFVDSVWEIFGALANGDCIVVCKEEELQDLDRLVDSVARHRINCCITVASQMEALLEDPVRAQRFVSGMRLLAIGGEVLHPGVADAVASMARDAVLLNVYGSSELAADVAAFDFSSCRMAQKAASVPIGRAIDHTQIYLLNDWMDPVPAGTVGEIYVGGSALARGYLRRADLSAERFVPNPFGASHGERLFRTGDLGRVRADGLLEFVGRVDRQLKVRGFRVEPEEVECVLRTHPDVKDCAIIGRLVNGGDMRVIAYWVRRPQAQVSASDLRSWAARRLPRFMLPTHWVEQPHLPVNANGKLDRHALPLREPHPSGVVQASGADSEFETALLQLWTEVLGNAPESKDDNFFDAGGNSLLMMRLKLRLRQRTGMDIPLIQFAQWPTLAGFVNQFKEAWHREPATGQRSADAEGVERRGET